MNIIKTVIVPDVVLPAKIKAARKEDGRSVFELAGLAGISKTYWYNIEAGNLESISEEVLRRIEKALNTNLNSLYKVPIKF